MWSRTKLLLSSLLACNLLIAVTNAQDCNNNGIPDADDIAVQRSNDCNRNGIPDGCELAVNDCNRDGILDECQGLSPIGGPVLEFIDSNDQVAVPSSASLLFESGDPITIEALLRGNNLSSARTVLSKSRNGQADYFVKVIDEHLQFGYHAGDEAALFVFESVEPRILPDTWQHIAITHVFGTPTAAMYVDGQEVAAQWRDAPPSIGPDPSSAQLRIGAERRPNNPLLQDNWKGALDEMRVFRRIRDASEINQDRRTPIAVDTAGLVAYWRFDEAAGVVVGDATGNNPGTLVDGLWGRSVDCLDCFGDTNGDTQIDLIDLATILSQFNQVAANQPGDLNDDGATDLTDLAIVLDNFGRPCESPGRPFHRIVGLAMAPRAVSETYVGFDVAVAFEDSEWLNGVFAGTTADGARFVYALDPNGAAIALQPDRDGPPLEEVERFVTFASRPRPQESPRRFRRNGSLFPYGTIDGTSSTFVLEPNTIDMVFSNDFITRDPEPGFIVRLVLDVANVPLEFGAESVYAALEGRGHPTDRVLAELIVGSATTNSSSWRRSQFRFTIRSPGDCNTNGIPDTLETDMCAADLNTDQRIDLSDLAIVLASFGESGPGDIDQSGSVDLSDLASVLGFFGCACAD